MAQEPSTFEALVSATIDALPQVAGCVRRNISDANLLRAAAADALSRLTNPQLEALLSELLARRDPVVCGEVVALLVSLHEIDADHAHAYYDDRHPPIYLARYRFELAGGVDHRLPEWLSATSSPQEYVRTIIAQAVATHLLENGDWERPSLLAPSRRLD